MVKLGALAQAAAEVGAMRWPAGKSA